MPSLLRSRSLPLGSVEKEDWMVGDALNETPDDFVFGNDQGDQIEASGEKESEVLFYNESLMVSALQKEDIQLFCKKLYEATVISKDIRDRFSTLDHNNLTPYLRARYLLQDVYSRVRGDREIYNLFVRVWEEIDRDVYNKLCQGTNTAEVDQANDGEGSFHVVRSLGNYCEYTFQKKDVETLWELLIEASFKWEELGLVLKLPKYTIEECKANCGSNSLKLNNMLREWISGREKYSGLPTLSTLKKALEGKIVRLPNLACSIEEKFLGMRKTVFTQSKSKSKSNIRIVRHSSDTMVQHCKSALLGIQAKSNKPLRYKWKKDGDLLNKNDIYAGVHSDILFIDNVGGRRQGKYRCQVETDDQVINSEEITLEVDCSPLAKKFITRYNVAHMWPTNSWPPKITTEFINLALITRDDSMTDIPEYQHDVDSIIQTKERVKYELVFGMYRSGALMLVEGRPGSGKTTLMLKVVRDWAKKKDILWDARLVVLVPLRLLSIDKAEITLSDILNIYIKDDREKMQLIEKITREDGDRLCIIFDGLDEYKYREDERSVVYQLIHKLILPLAMIIVASRPMGTAFIRSNDQDMVRYEVLGFTKEQIFEYVDSYYKNHTALAENLKHYLRTHANVWNMCYLPVYAAIICFLYSNLKDKIPDTETEVYQYFTRLTLQRELKVRGGKFEGNVESLTELPIDIKEHFSNICRLAFNMKINSKQVMLQTKTEFPLSDLTSRSDTPSLGLVIIDSTAEIFHIRNTYSFLHFTFQEFLAAFYLASLTGNEQQRFFYENSGKKEFQNVLKYFFGITKVKECKLPLLKSIMADTTDILCRIHFAFESQQDCLCDSVLDFGKTDTLLFHNHVFTSADFLALSYVISASNFGVTKLAFEECQLDEDGVNLLADKLSETQNLKLIKSFGYQNNHFSPQCEVLNLLLNKLPSLEILDFKNTVLDRLKAEVIAKDVKLPCLNTLKISTPLLTDIHVVELLHFGNSEIKKILCCECAGSYDYVNECRKYAELCSTCGGFNIFFDPNTSLLFYCNSALNLSHHNLISFSNIFEIFLINCDLEDNDVEVMVEPMKSWRELKIVHLDHNNITSEGISFLSSVFHNCVQSEVFSAHCNKIDDSGAKIIAKELFCVDSFRKLDLQHNLVSKEGMEEIFEIGKGRYVSGGQPYFVSRDESCAVHNHMLASKESPLDLSELDQEAYKALQHSLAIVNECNHGINFENSAEHPL